MQHTDLTRQSMTTRRSRAVAATTDHQRMMRGLVNGLLLSLVVWLTAGYLTIILR